MVPLHRPTASTARDPTRVVALGASAGGLEPLEQFLANVPAGSGFAYVVVQHLDPSRRALLSELLQRVTSMPVHEATESQRLEPGAVYVIPPNAELTVAGGRLHLAEPARPRGMRLPIDVLFSSLARDQGDKAIGVVLSGMGSDGTLGLQAIRMQGGLTLAQEPSSAQFDAMPASAVAAGCADIVALPGELPARILDVVRSTATSSQAAAGEMSRPLNDILELLHQRSKHDMALYKASTLVRRVERRMAVHRLPSMEDYHAFVVQNPAELDLLFKELLIGVTAFFRDKAVWQELKDVVLPELMSRCVREGGRLRAWVAGCSTGEEALSLAMLFQELVEERQEYAACELQIFATDINADAIAVARKGQYPASIAGDVSPDRLARFFVPRAGGFLIDKQIRERVLFAQHDLILDPPFTRLDMLSCRNLMIYFGSPLQRRVVPLFHYSLRQRGALLLGGSETVGRSQSLFTPLHPKSRLYWRTDNAAGASTDLIPDTKRSPWRPPATEAALSTPPIPPVTLQALADQVVLQGYAPPAVLVNDEGDIVYISGRTGRYLEPAAGKANWNIHVMARPGLRASLATAIRSTSMDRQPVELRGLKPESDSPGAVDVSVRALSEPKALEGMVLVVFRDVAAPRSRGRKPAAEPADVELTAGLARAQEEIRALRQEMRASQEELQAANEELQSTNEELQSANEELTTSKEEAQSMNEELQTINSELQSKLDDLALAQSDMQNLLNSTDIATLFLDNDLNVRRFTEQIGRVIHLRPGDIGRPLNELATRLVYPELIADVSETLRTLAFCEKQIPSADGHWYSVRIMPYRTLANMIQGAVLTFVDITAAKDLEARLRKA